MKLHEHFLPDDLDAASREFHCLKDLLIKINSEIRAGNIEKAKHLSIDLTRSLHELSELAYKKTKQDNLFGMMGPASIYLYPIKDDLND